MDVWGPVIVGVTVTVLANFATMSYFYGRHTQIISDLKTWKEQDADPMLGDHATRIAILEGRMFHDRHGRTNL